VGLQLAAGRARILLLVGRGIISDALSIILANSVLLTAYGLLWAGCRAFAGRRSSPALVFAGGLVWAAACSVPQFLASFPSRVGMASALAVAYTLASAVELRRTRAEGLASQRPIVIVLALHALAMGSRPLALWTFDGSQETTLFSFPWITAHAFETLVATVLLAFLFLAIAKERVEQEQRIMASRDFLTGMLNRRAFLELGTEALAAAHPDEQAVLLLLDIDRFKRINDAHGHAAGDAVLEALGRLATDALPRGSLLARLGGEEFGCLLPGTSQIEGFYAAEYLRNAVALHPFPAGRVPLVVTVSIGLATTVECGRDLQALMSAADAALYRAKRSGRDRVVCGVLPSTLAA
jgi:diguanylate cyclase (GGDEF)-like protein